MAVKTEVLENLWLNYYVRNVLSKGIFVLNIHLSEFFTKRYAIFFPPEVKYTTYLSMFQKLINNS